MPEDRFQRIGAREISHWPDPTIVIVTPSWVVSQFDCGAPLARPSEGTHNDVMATLPLIVKRRDGTGAVATVPCDTVKGALDNAKHFRDAGYTDVWIEDHEGRRIDESKLNA